MALWEDDEARLLRSNARDFFTRELMPNIGDWEQRRGVDRSFWRKAGELGFLCASIPEEYGGAGGTFAHEAVLLEEQARVGDTAFGGLVHSVIVAHYINSYGTGAQRRRWLPAMASGEAIGAIAMTEPGTGSDLRSISTTARRAGDDYVINGSKTFTSNGGQCDLLVLACKAKDTVAGALSLIVVETSDQLPGFRRGRVLEKVGMHGQDTAELFFDDVRVPVGNLLGDREGQGFDQLTTQLASERLGIAVIVVAAMEVTLEQTIAYVHDRRAFGQELMGFQHVRFTIAELATEVRVARTFLDNCIRRYLDGQLDMPTASMAKWWLTEKACHVVDNCMQLHGGYGYMLEYPVARAYTDYRVYRISGGSNEIMKEIIGRSLWNRGR